MAESKASGSGEALSAPPRAGRTGQTSQRSTTPPLHEVVNFWKVVEQQLHRRPLRELAAQKDPRGVVLRACSPHAHEATLCSTTST
ncbi:unnamed protein product, partial [Prorocentrum cordatum]